MHPNDPERDPDQDPDPWLGVPQDPELDEVVRRELELLDPATRAEADRLGTLLHPDFLEFGASGRVHTYASVLRDLPAAPRLDAHATDIAAVRLAADVILVTYSLAEPAVTRRSSVWVRDANHGWRLRFHQGTPAPIPIPVPAPAAPPQRLDED